LPFFSLKTVKTINEIKDLGVFSAMRVTEDTEDKSCEDVRAGSGVRRRRASRSLLGRQSTNTFTFPTPSN